MSAESSGRTWQSGHKPFMKEGGQSLVPRKYPELSGAFKDGKWINERAKEKMAHVIEVKRAFLQISFLSLDDWEL